MSKKCFQFAKIINSHSKGMEEFDFKNKFDFNIPECDLEFCMGKNRIHVSNLSTK